MMKNLKLNHFSILLLFTVVFSFQKSEAQSAWTKKKGELYSQISFNTIPNYNSIYSDSEYTTSREITDNTIQLYGEYGLSDDLTLLVNIPIKSIQTGAIIENSTFPLTISETSETTLGNLQVGVKHKLYSGKFVLAGQLNIEANTSSFDISSGIRSGYDAWTFTPTLNIGRGYSNFYFQAFTGVDIRTNSYSSNFKIGGELGITAIKRVVLVGFIDVVKSFTNGDITFPASSLETGLYINDQEYTAIGLKGLYSFTDSFGITAGLNSAFSANHVPKQMALSAGLFYKIN